MRRKKETAEETLQRWLAGRNTTVSIKDIERAKILFMEGQSIEIPDTASQDEGWTLVFYKVEMPDDSYAIVQVAVSPEGEKDLDNIFVC